MIYGSIMFFQKNRKIRSDKTCFMLFGIFYDFVKFLIVWLITRFAWLLVFIIIKLRYLNDCLLVGFASLCLTPIAPAWAWYWATFKLRMYAAFLCDWSKISQILSWKRAVIFSCSLWRAFSSGLIILFLWNWCCS